MSNKVSSIYTIVIVLLPFLNIYGSPIPSVEIGTLIIMLCTCYFLLLNKVSMRGDWVWLLLLFIFFFCTLLTDNPMYSSRYFYRYLKIVVIVLSIFFIGKKQINYNLALQTLQSFSLICTGFIVIQNLGNTIGIQIPGVIQELAAVQENADFDKSLWGMYRPSSFFIEPSHFASFQFVYICYLLTNPNIYRRNIYLVFTLFGIFLSTSGTGYTIVPILILGSLFLGKDKLSIKKIALVSLSIIILFFLATNSQIGQSTLGRFILEDGTIGGAATGRIDSGASNYFYNLPFSMQLIGTGFGFRPDDVYFPSLYAILYGNGYIGLGCVILVLIYYIINNSPYGKLLTICYALLFIGTGIFNFASIGLYFSFISKEKQIHKYLNLLKR